MNWPEALVQWFPDDMEMLKRALFRYQQLLQQKKSTTTIVTELKKVQDYRARLKETIARCEDEGDSASPKFLMDDYAFLADVLWKYKSALTQELRERKQSETIKGELENEEAELASIVSILKMPIFMQIEEIGMRRNFRILAESLYIQPDELKIKDKGGSMTNVTQNIGTLHGVAVGHNQGTINYTHNPEITALLEKYIALVSESEIPAEEKVNYIADLEIIKAETRKRIPDKELIEKKMPSITELAAFTELATFSYKVGESLGTFISSLLP